MPASVGFFTTEQNLLYVKDVRRSPSQYVQAYRKKHPSSFIRQSMFFSAVAHIKRDACAQRGRAREDKNVFVFVLVASLPLQTLQMLFDK